MAGMERKSNARSAVVTESGAHAALRRGPARELSPEEERVMRMRLGAAPARQAPLERVAEGLTDLEIEVRAMEIEAFLRWKEWREEREGRPAATPQPSRAKDKIVRALRKKS
jgi:hypothetical protein